MQYFKNVELTKLYPVSESAVRKWIEAARQGKLPLQLYEHNGKAHIANTTKNTRTIEELIEKGKKFKNSRSHRVVTPKPGFRKLFNKNQILDIISNIDTYHEIPSQYGYFDGGAIYWDKYAKRLWEEDSENTLNATIELLSSNQGSIDSLIQDYEKVNIIDLGVGNCLPVKEMLTHLLYDRGVLGRYIAVDHSNQMLDIAEKNIEAWFEGRVQFERHQRDFSRSRIDDLIAEETIIQNEGAILNIVLLLGGTLANFRFPDDVLRTIRMGMGRNDLLLTTQKLDSEEARRFFDFHIESDLPRLSQNERIVLDLMNIDESFYDVEQGYDSASRVRYIRVRLKLDLTVEFSFASRKRHLELQKGQTILLWRSWHQSTLNVIDQLHNNGFALLQASVTKDRHYLLTINKIDNSPHSMG